ncbi:MAG: hypothetical protein JSR27_04995 [Proteobacteria bacterium]|nr:hypothetical protein [Pseudomonadota bacterium]
MNLFTELQRRNVPRAALLYAGATWALAQGIAQLGPFFGLPDWGVRWFVIACCVGFPFWLVFAWVYEWTAQGLKRESEIAADPAISRSTGRKLDRAIIAVLAVAVVLLLTDRFVVRKGDGVAIAEKSVAVLPLANESGDQDQQYFSDGLSDDLINALMQFGNLKVIGRASSFQFRDSRDSSATIGHKLGVAYLLTGSVRKLGDTVRINAQLVKAADGSGVWSRSYDRPYADLFTLQDEITAAVADALKAKLLTAPGAVVQSDRPPSGNLAAYAAYQHGFAYYALNTEAGSRQAIRAFEDATNLDPRYAAAYARLSMAWTRLASHELNEPAEIALAKTAAHKAADTALAVDADLAMAHQARAFLLQNLDMDWRGAEAESRRALQLAPNDAEAQSSLGSQLASLGQNRRAVELTRQALSSDPRNASWHSWLSAYLVALDQLDDARAAIDTAIGLQSDAATFHAGLATIQILRGESAGALAAARQETDQGWYVIATALASQIDTDRAAADAALENLIMNKADAAAYQIAQVYALRRDADNVFKWLDRAWNNRDAGLGTLLSDPLVLRYRDDPRFAVFCKKIGLPTTTDAVAMK